MKSFNRNRNVRNAIYDVRAHVSSGHRHHFIETGCVPRVAGRDHGISAAGIPCIGSGSASHICKLCGNK